MNSIAKFAFLMTLVTSTSFVQGQQLGDPQDALVLASQIKQAWVAGDSERLIKLTQRKEIEIPDLFLRTKPNDAGEPKLITNDVRIRAWVYAQSPEQSRGIQPDDRPFLELVRAQNGDWKLAQISVDALENRTQLPPAFKPLDADSIAPAAQKIVQQTMTAYQNQQGIVPKHWLRKQPFWGQDVLFLTSRDFSASDFFLERVHEWSPASPIIDAFFRQCVVVQMDQVADGDPHDAICYAFFWVNQSWRPVPMGVPICKLLFAPRTTALNVPADIQDDLRQLFLTGDRSKQIQRLQSRIDDVPFTMLDQLVRATYHEEHVLPLVELCAHTGDRGKSLVPHLMTLAGTNAELNSAIGTTLKRLAVGNPELSKFINRVCEKDQVHRLNGYINLFQVILCRPGETRLSDQSTMEMMSDLDASHQLLAKKLLENLSIPGRLRPKGIKATLDVFAICNVTDSIDILRKFPFTPNASSRTFAEETATCLLELSADDEKLQMEIAKELADRFYNVRASVDIKRAINEITCKDEKFRDEQLDEYKFSKTRISDRFQFIPALEEEARLNAQKEHSP